MLKTHKGIGEEVALKKDLRSTKRERDATREKLRALSNERRVLNQNLEEAEAGRIEAESRVLNTALYEMKLMRAEHAQQMSSSNEAWGTLIDQELEELRLKNEDTA